MCLPARFWRTQANSRHTCTYDVTVWLSRTTDNSNIFIRSREVRDNESRLQTSNEINASAKVIELKYGSYGLQKISASGDVSTKQRK